MRLPWQKPKSSGSGLPAGQPIIFMQAPPAAPVRTLKDDIRELQEQNVSFYDAFRDVTRRWRVGVGDFHRAWTAVQREEKKNGWFI